MIPVKLSKMGYWNSKVVPRFKKIFEKSSVKKAAAAEACKTFDESKDIWEFPGSTAVKDAASSFGAGYVSGPVTFIFEKVCVFLPEEVKTREVPVKEVKAEEPPKPRSQPKPKNQVTVTTAVVEEHKPEVAKEEEKKPIEEVKKEEAAPPPAPEVVESPAKAPETTTPAPVAEPSKP
ncbi:hypothetical protein HID58_078933 [Brassica napus]|uniref:Plasma membrane-associated cation-binding protein 1 n=1 Tax=Brassica napus TaxID=3708 RepID=A0ABQ7XFY6_BRANA|nr:hypothetical protein HID58_078933 [Brassica napus]